MNKTYCGGPCECEGKSLDQPCPYGDQNKPWWDNEERPAMTKQDIKAGRVYAVRMPNGGTETLKLLSHRGGWYRCFNVITRNKRKIHGPGAFITELAWGEFTKSKGY